MNLTDDVVHRIAPTGSMQLPHGSCETTECGNRQTKEFNCAAP